MNETIIKDAIQMAMLNMNAVSTLLDEESRDRVEPYINDSKAAMGELVLELLNEEIIK